MGGTQEVTGLHDKNGAHLRFLQYNSFLTEVGKMGTHVVWFDKTSLYLEGALN